MACGSGDAVDHAGAIRQLMRQAPAAAARLGPGSNVSAAVPCLSAGDWARLLLEAAGGPNRWSINPQCAAADTHAPRRLTRPSAAPLTTRRPCRVRSFMAQSDSCGYATIGYHRLIPLDQAAGGMRLIAAALGLPSQPLGHAHVVKPSSKRAVPDDAKALLEKWLAYDIQTLQYPKE